MQIFAVVPKKGDGLMSHFGNHVVGVVVAVGAGKDKNPNFMLLGYQVGGRKVRF